MIERLGLFGVEYLISTSYPFFQNLSALPPGQVALQIKSGQVGVFRLNTFRPLLEETEHRPWLFVDQGGISFRAFAEEWYKHPELFGHPVIYSPKGYWGIAAAERRRLGGLIISLPAGYVIGRAEFEGWRALTGDRVVFLGAEPRLDFSAGERGLFFSNFSDPYAGSRMSALLLDIDPLTPKRQGIVPEFNQANRLIFNSRSGVIINHNYAPEWRSASSKQTVFMVTPSLIFVFGRGGNDLCYGAESKVRP